MCITVNFRIVALKSQRVCGCLLRGPRFPTWYVILTLDRKWLVARARGVFIVNTGREADEGFHSSEGENAQRIGELSFAVCVVLIPKFRGKDCAGGPSGKSVVGKNFQCALPVAVVGRFGC